MPEIPTITSNQHVHTGPVADADASDYEMITPAAFHGIANDLNQIQDSHEKRVAQSDHFWALSQYSKMRLELGQGFSKAVENITPGDPNFAANVLKTSQDYMNAQVGQAPNTRAARILAQQQNMYLNHIYERAQLVERAETVRYNTESATRIFDETFQNLQQNPSQLHDSVGVLKATLASVDGRIPRETYSALQKRLNTLPSFALSGLSFKQPDQALQGIDAGLADGAPQGQVDAVKSNLQNRSTLVQAGNRQDQQAALKSAAAQIRVNGVDSTSFNPEVYGGSFGKQSDSAAGHALSEIDAAHKFYAADSPMNSMSPDQMNTHISQYQSDPRLFNELQKSVATRQKQLYSDPFSYSMRNPDVQSAYEAAHSLGDQAGNDPAKIEVAQMAMKKAIDSSLLYQKSIGVPDAAQRPISKNDAIFYASKIQKSGADGLQQSVQDMQNRYGDYFPQVFKELQSLPPAQRVAPTMQLAIAHLGSPFEGELIQALQNPSKNLTSETGVPKAKASIDKAIINNPLIQSFQQATTATSPDNAQYAKDILTGVRQFAYHRMMAGSDPQKASTDAAQLLIGGLYDFDKVNGSTYAISRTGGSGTPYTQTQVDTIKDNVKFLTNNLSDRLETGNIDPSNFKVDSGKPLEENFLQSSLAKSAITHGLWTTSPDNTGLRLNIRQNDGKVVPVMTKSGGFFGFSFDSIKDYSFAKERADFSKSNPSQLLPSLTFMPTMASDNTPVQVPQETQ